MPAFPKFLSQYQGSKIIAVLLALVVYAHVTTERERSAEFDASVRLTGLGPNLVLRSEPLSVVPVQVRAKGKQLWKLRMDPPEVVVDLAGMTAGDVQRMLSPADVILPVDSDAVVQALGEPRMLFLDIDSLVTRTVPVAVRLAGQLPPDAAWDGAPTARPESVDVRGPSGVIDALGEMATETVPVAGLRRSVERRVAVLPGRGELAVRPDTVTVVLPVLPQVDRSLGRVAVQVDLPRGEWSVRVMPDSATVLVSGPEGLVETLTAAQVEVRLDARGLGPGLHRLAPRFLLPHEKLRVTALVPSEFLVEVGEAAP